MYRDQGTLVASALAALALTTGTAVGQKLPPPPVDRVPDDLPVQASVWEAVKLSGSLPIPELRQRTGDGFVAIADDGYVHVEIVGPEGAPSLDLARLAAFAARVEGQERNHVDAWIPLSSLEACARSLPPGHRVLRASPGELDDVAGEGPAAIGSDSYRDGGANGFGRSIAIIDSGFNGLSAARANGDAPISSVTTTINLTSSSFESGSQHGTGCVEAAYDHCPGADWRLYRVNSAADALTAVNDAIANDVDVISMSLSRYNLGWEDDSGIACLAANLAADNGILYFTSAGNRAQQHWQGDFSSGSGDPDWHDFTSGGDETINITMGPDASISFYLAWDTSGGTHDYDLYLYDTALNVLASSTSSGETFEDFSYTNPSSISNQVVHLAVYRQSGGGTEFEVFGHGAGTWERWVSAGSTTSPSNTTNQSVISVGAVSVGSFGLSSPSTMSYSSQGPSNGGMTVPDLTGPTNTSGFTYGTFTGTSCATPNVAGAACAFWSARPTYSNTAIRWLLYEQAELLNDWGDGGNDNVFGFGGTTLWPYAVSTRWLARDFGNTAEASSGPNYTLQGAYDATPLGGRILIFPGGTYPETPTSTMTRAMEIETVVNDAVLGGS